MVHASRIGDHRIDGRYSTRNGHACRYIDHDDGVAEFASPLTSRQGACLRDSCREQLQLVRRPM